MAPTLTVIKRRKPGLSPAFPLSKETLIQFRRIPDAPLFLFAGGNDLLLYISGNLFIPQEGHCKASSGLRHGSQIRRVGEHLRGGNLSLNDLFLALMCHSQYAPAALIHVSDNVSHIGFRITGLACGIPVLKAIEVAILKAISEESTGW